MVQNYETKKAKNLILNVNWRLRVDIYNKDSAKLFIDIEYIVSLSNVGENITS